MSVTTLGMDATRRDTADGRADAAMTEAGHGATRTHDERAERSAAQILREWRAAERELVERPADRELVARIRALRHELERVTKSRD